MTPKIVIIGGDLEGIVSALKLSRLGRQITIIEKSKWPVTKICGEGTMPQ